MAKASVTIHRSVGRIIHQAATVRFPVRLTNRKRRGHIPRVRRPRVTETIRARPSVPHTSSLGSPIIGHQRRPQRHRRHPVWFFARLRESWPESVRW